MAGIGQREILICDGSDERRATLSKVLSVAGCRIREIHRFSALVASTRALDPSAVVVGCTHATARDAVAAVEQLHAVDRSLPIVLIASQGSEALAVAALRAGVADYFAEPLEYGTVAAGVHRCMANAGSVRALPSIKPPRPLPTAPVTLVGSSGVMRAVESYLTKIAERDVTVLITGETGTGKELAAALIHGRSQRRANSFVTVNCAAIPETLLEAELFGHESGAFTGAIGARPGLMQVADRGTLFLDEIGEMGLVGQAKLLRAIEAREVYRVGGKKPIPLDVRVVAASNQDLEQAVDGGQFRKDLYFRLNVARVHLPPLRERRGDIAALLDHYLREMNARCATQVEGFSDETLERLQAYDWPGNIRELKNLVEAILVSPPVHRVTVDDLPEQFRKRLRDLASLAPAERERLLDALTTANWNKSRAAGLLHWSRMTVYRKMAKYSVQRAPRAAARRH